MWNECAFDFVSNRCSWLTRVSERWMARGQKYIDATDLWDVLHDERLLPFRNVEEHMPSQPAVRPTLGIARN